MQYYDITQNVKQAIIKQSKNWSNTFLADYDEREIAKNDNTARKKNGQLNLSWAMIY